MDIVPLVIILNAAALHIGVSVFIARRDDLNLSQKVLQILVVWLIPFVAAIGFWVFLKGQDGPTETGRGVLGGGPRDSGHVSSGGGSEDS